MGDMLRHGLGTDSGALSRQEQLGDRPELTLQMAKKLLASVTSIMQEELQRRGAAAAAACRDEELHRWGLAGTAELDDCLRRCCNNDQFLHAWLSLYRELCRAAEPVPPTAELSAEVARLLRSRVAEEPGEERFEKVDDEEIWYEAVE
eukprot:gnl/TRDRNA2_/TRDRNA2_82855_c0_seq1.p1 gnl/TRDRNA2_/TRDRNA2_82855_c0~~gnl/TRDRNA2_/TRDRNA2_82855_c0_seq1.p1  ORF type:complete len:148 (+),score=40.48 gnl/TRDRNA2_/TRDRNA2_82855_c0_seq1:129-572(+)